LSISGISYLAVRFARGKINQELRHASRGATPDLSEISIPDLVFVFPSDGAQISPSLGFKHSSTLIG
jgi:hypothetical protein